MSLGWHCGVPKSLCEVQLFLNTLSVDDGVLLRVLEQLGLRAWCRSFRFEDMPGNIPSEVAVRIMGSQVDEIPGVWEKTPESGTLLHYTDVTARSMRTLIHAGVPVDETNTEGLTPLFIAVASGRKEETFTLLDLGSDPEKLVEDEDGWTVLHHAASSGRGPTTLKRLLEGGCGLIDHADKDGCTAMFFSSEETFALLLAKGADMSPVNTLGHDVLEHLHHHLDETGEDDEFIETMEQTWAAYRSYRSPIFQPN